MEAVQEERVRVEIGDDQVGVVTLDRADKLNALDWSTFAGLHAAVGHLASAAAEGAVRAVLLRGAGRAFSAGLDVSLFGEQAAGQVPDEERIAWLQQAFTGFEDLPVPTIAALRGPTFGAGMQLALACHLRLTASDLRLGLLEARWALIPDLGATYRLPRLVGVSRAFDLAATARELDAATAAAWGLVDAVIDEDFDAAARQYAARLAAGPTVAIGALPGLLRASFDNDRASALAAERRAQQDCLRSADFAEAAAAGLAGRDPRFAGR